MRRVGYWVSGILLLTMSSSGASLCMNGSLASYIALGATGCTIGSNTVYDFQTVSGTAGATPIATLDVTIQPSGGSLTPELSMSLRASASANTELETIFTYRISGNSYIGSMITLSGSSETGDGGVTDVQTFCAGGTFGPDGLTGCTGSPGTLLTLDGVQNQDSTALGPAGVLSITDDLVLDGGLAGSASGGAFADQFTAVPEPLEILLAGLGLALIVGSRVARFKK